ncbi:hypothetical protein SPURM210S_05745 [Streptomyces purpurascens]
MLYTASFTGGYHQASPEFANPRAAAGQFSEHTEARAAEVSRV